MKAVILAGGFGTRLSEETTIKPKPMVEIGGRPILWHIMKIYSQYNINEFIICCGYKSYIIKEYFANYFLHRSDITFDIHNNEIMVHKNNAEPWKVSLIDTGHNTMTGGRIKKIAEYLDNEPFCITYGDGVSDVNIHKLVDFHKKQNVLLTITAVQPPGRFGAITLKENQTKITQFREKPTGDGAWINGGFMVADPMIMKYIEDDMTVLEQKPMQQLARDGLMAAYKHNGFWQSMDTLRDKMLLEGLWKSKNAPWSLWDTSHFEQLSDKVINTLGSSYDF